MTVLLFLDFDGTLHGEPCYCQEELFSRVPFLETAIQGLDVQIVISSTWRESWALGELRAQFPESIAKLIVGKTPLRKELPDPTVNYPRQVEIELWLRQNDRPWDTRWVALDNEPWLFRPFCPNLVLCNSDIGLDAETADLLRQALIKGL